MVPVSPALTGFSMGMVGCRAEAESKEIELPISEELRSHPIVIFASVEVAAVIVVWVAITVLFALNHAKVAVDNATMRRTTIKTVEMNMLFLIVFIFRYLTFISIFFKIFLILFANLHYNTL